MKKALGILSLTAVVGLAACGGAEEVPEENGATGDDGVEDDTEDTEETADADEDDVWAEIQEEGTLVVGTSGTYAPVTFYEGDDLTGFDVELVRAIGEELGVEVEFSTMDFDGILPALRNGQIHMAANDFAITEERQETFELTEPYKFSYGSAIVRAEDADRFESARDLEGVPVALGSLTSNYAQFAENIGADGTAYDGGVEAILRDVVNENQDAYLNDYLVLQRTLEGFDDDRLAIAEDVKYHATESVMMMRQGNTGLKEVIDEAIATLHENGTIAELSEEFYGEDASEPVDTDDIVTLEGE
ncbi:transporter substrate-binding domain-containing protein [Alteribacter natronophilus]|uniref:transporter substrate-binding domain-containing protein n=1 Tax=Alteribacter natronophilus TaxID=2583810 RepID=UPI00110E1D56|nr:transporter substrate-binding domain-containing protein [Alteribacter natronophilus]TMW70881.1 transporter substrate-binding domain-containing protein [Alteribacter natronophilus]